MIRGDLVAAPRVYGHAANGRWSAEVGSPSGGRASGTPKLTRAERTVLKVLEHHVNGKTFAFPSQKRLVRETEYAPRTVKAAIAGLQAKQKLVAKRLADLTDEERLLVERACQRPLRNWRNNVYFRRDTRDVLRGSDCPRSGAIPTPDTSLWDGKDQDRKSHHQRCSDRGDGAHGRPPVIVDDAIAERACRQIVAGWPAQLRSGFDEGLAMIVLRRRLSEGMSVRNALDANEGAALEAERLIREAKTTAFVLVFGRCDGWRRFAEASQSARAARTQRDLDQRKRREADVELERSRLSPKENAEAIRALLAVLEQPRDGVRRSPRPGHTVAPPPANPPGCNEPDDDGHRSREQERGRAVHALRDVLRENPSLGGDLSVGCEVSDAAQHSARDHEPREQLDARGEPERPRSDGPGLTPRTADAENDRVDGCGEQKEPEDSERVVRAQRHSRRHEVQNISISAEALTNDSVDVGTRSTSESTSADEHARTI
jgi:hypothetical protein